MAFDFKRYEAGEVLRGFGGEELNYGLIRMTPSPIVLR
jgi:hypothetical protein